jgi:MFS family permease
MERSTQDSTPADSAKATRAARWILGLLLAINLVNYIDRYMLAAMEPLIREDFFPEGGDNARFYMGLLSTAFLFSYMLTAPLFGWMADRVSRWLIIGAGVIAWSLASGASGLATSYLMLLMTRLLVGVGEAAYGPAAPTVIADIFPVERRGKVLAWFYAAIPVGSALGYIIGGRVGHHWGWRWSFYLSVIPGIALGIWALSLRDKRLAKRDQAPLEPPTAAAEHHQAKLRDYLIFWRTPSYVLNTAGMTAMTFALGGIAFWMPSYIFSFRQAASLDRANEIFGLLTVLSGITATLLGGWTGDKLRTRWPSSYFLVSGVSMVLALPLFLLTLVTPFPAAWGLIFLTEFCLFFSTGPTNTVLANVTPAPIRASGYALNILIIHLLGDAISPPLIGKITDLAHGDMNIGFVAVSFAILLSGLFWLWGARYLAEDTRRAPLRLEEAREAEAG